MINEVFLDKIKYINWNIIKPSRSGVIVYTITNNIIYFIMGNDTKSGDLTDFGGTVIYKTDINAVNGGLREFDEESLGVFGKFNYTDVENDLAVYSKNMLIMFVYVSFDFTQICNKFNELLLNTINPEVNSIKILNESELKNALNNNTITIYSKVKNHLCLKKEFIEILKNNKKLLT